MTDVVADALYGQLFDVAERVRWQMDDIHWERIDLSRVTPELKALVREIAFSELTTTTATRRFLTDLADDTDFTQWVSVWFYEETKHPDVLLRWLQRAGVTVDQSFMQRGRATAPLMRSRMGTLVTNIISEMAAAAAYTNLYNATTEPVLVSIARNLAADEARHAASFYAYAKRHLERSSDREADRRDALKVLYLWFQDNERVRHPVNEFYARNAKIISNLAFAPLVPRERIIRLIGTLIDMPLAADTDLLGRLRELDGNAHREGLVP